MGRTHLLVFSIIALTCCTQRVSAGTAIAAPVAGLQGPGGDAPAAPGGESKPHATTDVVRFDSSRVVVAATPGDEEPLMPLPNLDELLESTDLVATPARVQLGSMLFHDTRLSKDFTVSCATCHDLRFGGADRSQRAVGIHGQVGPVNTPTVFNSVLQVAQFWDGRADSLQEQAAGPPQAAGEMGSSFEEIVGRLQLDRAYEVAFRAAFPQRVNGASDIDRELVLEAIATFEATLITPDSPFDRWLRGEADAMPGQALRGYALFKEIGCADCHYGTGIGGKAFQKLGRKLAYFTGKHIAKADLGRFNVTNDERDRYTFKVPTLRNVAATGPYFHDGSVATLHDAVGLMARHQLGYELSDHDTDDLVAFLESLTGTYAGRPLLPPAQKDGGAKESHR